jgi:hypothetical protein
MIKLLSAKVLATSILMAGFGSVAAQAATLDLGFDLEVDYQTVDGVRTNTSTYATDIAGSIVTATYTDGTTETLIWERLSEWTGDVVSTGMDLAFQWWGFDLTTTNRLKSLSFDLAPSGTIFDAGYTEGTVGNTPGTYGGIPLHLTEFNSSTDAPDTSVIGTVEATYSGLVQLVGHAPGMDAFTRLLIDFSGTEGGGLLGAVTLALDMDVLEGGANDLSPVPLPAGILLLLAGLGAFGFLRLTQTRERAVVPLAA